MNRYQIIDLATGHKVNVILWDAETPWSPGEGFRVEPDDGSPIVSDEPPPTLPAITDRQFGRGLWGDGVITFPECAAFVATGVIPAALQDLVDTLPDDDTGRPTPRKEAIVFLTGAKDYFFDHPLVDVIRQRQGWSVERLRERWAVWATL